MVPAVAVLATLFAVLSDQCYSQELTGPHRALLQTADSIDDELGPVTQASVFQQVSASNPRMVYPIGSTSTMWAVANLNASLELDTNATFANNFRANSPRTWEAGQSRLNISLSISTYALTSAVLPTSLQARIHSEHCAQIGTNSLDSVYSHADNDSYIDLTATLRVANQTAFNSSIFNFLVDYDNALSVVVYNGNSAVSCSDMVPPFPDFPNEWQATIEMNRVDQGTTWAIDQTYSQSKGKVRMDVHSKGSARVILQDFVNNEFWIISQPNSTYPNGSCRQRKFWPGMNRLFDNATSELISTAEMLHFTEDEGPEYVPGQTNVRGIPCEEWSLEQQYGNASFTTSFFFPVNEWLVAREDYHRLLKRVYMNGTYGNYPFETYIEYVNFRPYISSYALLDLCSIAPKLSNNHRQLWGWEQNMTKAYYRGYGCGCDKKSSNGVVATQSGVIIEGAASSCSIPKWFISAQSRPYILLSFLCFFGGLLIAALGSYLYYRRFVGVTPTDRMGHTRFVDETPAGAFKM